MDSRIDVAKHKTWLAVNERFLASGLSQAEFCRQEKISVKRFIYWHRQYREGRLRTATSKKSEKRQQVLLPVTIAPPLPKASKGAIEVIVVRLPVDVDEESLRRVFACLSRTSC